MSVAGNDDNTDIVVGVGEPADARTAVSNNSGNDRDAVHITGACVFSGGATNVRANIGVKERDGTVENWQFSR